MSLSRDDAPQDANVLTVRDVRRVFDCWRQTVRVGGFTHSDGLAFLQLITEASAPQWQPIETAPRGRIVLLFAVTDVDERGIVRNWKMLTGSRDFRPGTHGANETEWTWDGDRLKVYDHQPTHWMPLPDPPASDVSAPTPRQEQP